MTDERPAVSVLVPCWNEESQIETYIRTSLSQEFPKDDFEYIVTEGME